MQVSIQMHREMEWGSLWDNFLKFHHGFSFCNFFIYYRGFGFVINEYCNFIFFTYATFEDLIFPHFWEIARIYMMFIKFYFLFIFNK